MSPEQPARLAEPFIRRGVELCCGEVPLCELAAEYGTPLYVYNGDGVLSAYRAADRALGFRDHLVCYAVKANSNLSLLRALAQEGSGADIVSGGELMRCLEAGFSPGKIIFSGVGKRDEEILLALEHGIRSIHVESAEELFVVERLALERGKEVPVSLRVNPDVDADTHPYIATGLQTSKFGMTLETALELVGNFQSSDVLRFEGLACHIGSQIGSSAPIRESTELVARAALRFEEAGLPSKAIDVGGGWPVSYEEGSAPPFEEFGAAIAEGLQGAGARDRPWTLLVEPGRALVAPAGALVTRVLFTKRQYEKRFVVVDGAMTELLRPSLYQAHHRVELVRAKPGNTERQVVDVVGPVCESGDFLATARSLAPLERGDLLCVLDAGAYAMSMASNYNTRPRAAEVWVREGRARLIRHRETAADLWQPELSCLRAMPGDSG